MTDRILSALPFHLDPLTDFETLTRIRNERTNPTPPQAKRSTLSKLYKQISKLSPDDLSTIQSALAKKDA